MTSRTDHVADASHPRRLAETEDGELRLVTVFFADIVGSTALVADLDPEEAAAVLAPALRAMRATIEQFGGTIIRFAGDGVLAVFGAPEAHEDDAARACHAARALIATDLTAPVGGCHSSKLALRVGLHSGDILFSRSTDLSGRSMQDIAGATVHLAARMEQSAAPGSIRLTRATALLVDRLFTTSRLGAIPAKGFTEPVETFVLGEPRVPSHADMTRDAASAFVGRESQMRALVEAASEARAGKGCAIAIVGEPGIGKSRLASEFLASPAADGFSATRAGAASIGETNANQSLFDLLGVLFDVPAVATADGLLDQLTVGALAGAPARRNGAADVDASRNASSHLPTRLHRPLGHAPACASCTPRAVSRCRGASSPGSAPRQ